MKTMRFDVTLTFSEECDETSEQFAEGLKTYIGQWGFKGVEVTPVSPVKRYRVKLINPEWLSKSSNSHVNGYLAFCGVVQEYGLSEARRKAKWVNGTVEPV